MNRIHNLVFPLILVMCLLAYAPYSFAALPASTTTWEVQPTNGVDTNGGCFIAGATGTDLSYPTSSPVAYTDLVAPTTTTITSAATPFSATSVGNCLKIVSGTGWTTGIYYVVSVAVATATVDRAIATASSTGGTGTFGGAIKTLTQLNTNMAGSNIAHMKAETSVTVTATITFNFAGVNGVPSQLIGYTTTRGDDGRVTLTTSGSTITLIVANVNSFNASNFILNCNSQTASQGYYGQANFGYVRNVSANNCLTYGFNYNGNGNHMCISCSSDGGAGTGFSIGGNGNVYCFQCVAVNHTASGWTSANYFTCIQCISANNTGATADGFQGSNGSTMWIINSVACGNGRDGIRMSSTTFGQGVTQISNNILTGNGVSAAGYGLNFTAMTVPVRGQEMFIDYNAYFSNTTGLRNNVSAGPHDVTLTATPYNCAGTDFTLNSTAGGGAAVKGAGFPGALLTGGTGYMDIGALQAAAAAASTGSASGFVQ